MSDSECLLTTHIFGCEVFEHRISLCGVICSVVECGNPEGHPLLCLHGWLDNAGSFAPLTPFFTEHRVFLLDFPGHGHSQHLPEGMAYHFLDLVYVIQDLVDHFGWISFDLIGHSMGGAAATLYASVTNKVSRLILLEALGPLTVSTEGTLELMQNAINDRRKQQSRELPEYRNIEHAVSVRAFHSKISPEVIRPVVERGIKPFNQGVTWNSDARLRVTSINRLTEEQLAPLLQAIDIPVLLIEANQGLFVQNTIVQARKLHFERLHTASLEGGHHVHMEHPQPTLDIVREFWLQNPLN